MTIDARAHACLGRVESLRAGSEALRVEWSSFEADVFSLLLQANVRPMILRIRGEKEAKFFRIDWVERRLVETPIDSVMVDIADVARFGNLVGGDDKQSSEESVDVSGIASSF